MDYNSELHRLIKIDKELAYILITFANLWHSNYNNSKKKDDCLIKMLKYLHGEIK